MALDITFVGIKPNGKCFDFSVINNAKVDVINFILTTPLDSVYTLEQLSEFNAYVKVQSAGGDYIDKISATSTYDSENEKLTVSFVLHKKTTSYKNIALQLQFEDLQNEIISQTEIVALSLKGTINADKEISDKYPEAIQELEKEVGSYSGRIEEVEEKVSNAVLKTDIVDNLDSEAIDKVLSANQGKVLNDKINTAISGVMHYKGSVQTYDDLPTENLTIGDLYNVIEDDSNYAWTGSEWDMVGSSVDLSNYYNKTETDALLGEKADKTDLNNYALKSLISDEYDNTVTYAVGSLVIYNNTLYRCTTAVTTPEAFDSSKWTAINVSDILESGTFNEINASDISNPLTAEQVAIFKNGKPTRIKGTFLGLIDAIYYPASYKDSGQPDNGLVVGQESSGANSYYDIRSYTISSSNILSIVSATGLRMSYRGNRTEISASNGTLFLKGKAFPAYPSSTGTFDFRCVGGTLSYKALGSYVADNTITELTYDNISVIEISADTTFTLKAPASNSMPEYKAKITNSGGSAINLTLPSGTVIKTNDENIVIASNVLTLPSGTTIELNLQDNNAIAFNWAV